MQKAEQNKEQPHKHASRVRGEIVRYLIFGVLTTLVSLIFNFTVLWGGRGLLGIEDDPAAPGYLTLYAAAKAVSWVAAVLFAFFTNKKFVFRDKVSGFSGVLRQLFVFSGSRLATLALDYLFNSAFLWLMSALNLSLLDGLLGLSLVKINELAAWGLTQVFVVVSNYFISKWLVFGKDDRQPAE